MSEARQNAETIVKLWPFIDIDEAEEFCHWQGGHTTNVATVNIALWCVSKVLEHELNKETEKT